MRRYIKIVQLIAVGFLVVALPQRSAGEETGSPARVAYLRYCSACHGESGKGDGVVSHLMRPRPTDLTKLARENEGEFPFAKTMRAIDGRETVRAHGNPDMPVWGEIFEPEDATTLDKQTKVRTKLMLITEHLSSIQVK
jgi:mono/diheme cytochrome c family protein